MCANAQDGVIEWHSQVGCSSSPPSFLPGVCNFLRLKLGYRPDPILIASLFSDLNRRVTGGDDMAKASASSHPARRAAAAAATASVGADETEMHLNTFISAIRGASTPHTAYSDHGGGLDPELDELMRSFDLMSESGGKSSVEESPRGLLSVAQLHHRLRVCRGDKLSESEFASLIEFAGTVDRNGRPISEAAAAGSEVFIPYKSFVNKLANNKPGGDV